MRVKAFIVAGTSILIFAAFAFSAPAEQYRGPKTSLPRGILPPTPDGPIGTSRLETPSRQVEGLDRWEFWWELNRNRFLRRAVERAQAVPAAGGAMTAFFQPPRRAALVSAEEVRRVVVPVLLSRLDSPDPEERWIAAVALGHAGEAAVAGRLLAMLERGSSPDRQAAALALGLLGDADAAGALSRYVRQSGIPARERALGVLSLALLGARERAGEIAGALVQSLAFRGRGVEEFQAACATALGILGGRDEVGLLVRVAARSQGRDKTVRGAAILALGCIGEQAVVPDLLRMLTDKQVDVRRAAAQALARLGSEAARPLLLEVLREDPDVMVRGLAAVALAEIGGAEVGEALLEGLGANRPRALRGYCALALGLLGEPAPAETLRDLLRDGADTGVAGAAAVALGLLEDGRSLVRLREVAADRRKDDDLRGYAVLALAMIGDRTLSTQLSAWTREPGAVGLRRSATLALGLLPGLKAGALVLGALLEEQDPTVRGAAVNALGFGPRQDVVDALVTVAHERGFSPDARKDALAALGALSRRGKPSRVVALLEHGNFRSFTKSMALLSAAF